MIGIVLYTGKDTLNEGDIERRDLSVSDGADTSGADHTGEGEAITEYDFKSLNRYNPDYVGWLTIDDTVVDYPVMKSSENDPEFYLHRDFYGNYSVSGCLFIGEKCTVESKSFVIYGHNMNNGSMFGALDEYYDYDYAERHRDIRFYVNGKERIYRVFAAFQTKVYDDRDDVFKYYEAVGDLTQAEYEQTVENVRALPEPKLPDAPQYPAQLMFLSTCSYPYRRRKVRCGGVQSVITALFMHYPDSDCAICRSLANHPPYFNQL